MILAPSITARRNGPEPSVDRGVIAVFAFRFFESEFFSQSAVIRGAFTTVANVVNDDPILRIKRTSCVLTSSLHRRQINLLGAFLIVSHQLGFRDDTDNPSGVRARENQFFKLGKLIRLSEPTTLSARKVERQWEHSKVKK
jgi:hypothetical protein